MANLVYLSIGYFTKLFNRDYVFDSNIIENIRNYINSNFEYDEENIYFIDFEKIDFKPATNYDITKPKHSPIFFSLENLILKSTNSHFVFLNCDIYIGSYIVEKDFIDTKNLYVLGTQEDYYFKSPNLKEDNLFSLLKEKVLSNLTPFDFDVNKHDSVRILKEKLIEHTIKKMLLHKVDGIEVCVNDVKRENHILKSTSVHVNKYINIKPLIENPTSFSLICYLLSEKIIDKMNIPDFIVGSSKNSFVIASGISFFINSDLLIINQISPITAYDNFSTLSKIDAKARYAVIEDFFCMGTETKIVKGILWSHGVNIDENIYTFPVASTDLLDKDNISMSENKIYPLYKIEPEFGYKIFTHYTCPVCNDITCLHRENFKLK